MALSRQQARANKARARNLFNKIDVLNSMTEGDDRAGANAERKAMRQRWEHRDMRPGTMFKQSNNKPSEVRYVHS